MESSEASSLVGLSDSDSLHKFRESESTESTKKKGKNNKHPSLYALSGEACLQAAIHGHHKLASEFPIELPPSSPGPPPPSPRAVTPVFQPPPTPPLTPLATIVSKHPTIPPTQSLDSHPISKPETAVLHPSPIIVMATALAEILSTPPQTPEHTHVPPKHSTGNTIDEKKSKRIKNPTGNDQKKTEKIKYAVGFNQSNTNKIVKTMTQLPKKIKIPKVMASKIDSIPVVKLKPKKLSPLIPRATNELQKPTNEPQKPINEPQKGKDYTQNNTVERIMQMASRIRQGLIEMASTINHKLVDQLIDEEDFIESRINANRVWLNRLNTIFIDIDVCDVQLFNLLDVIRSKVFERIQDDVHKLEVLENHRKLEEIQSLNFTEKQLTNDTQSDNIKSHREGNNNCIYNVSVNSELLKMNNLANVPGSGFIRICMHRDSDFTIIPVNNEHISLSIENKIDWWSKSTMSLKIKGTSANKNSIDYLNYSQNERTGLHIVSINGQDTRSLEAREVFWLLRQLENMNHQRVVLLADSKLLQQYDYHTKRNHDSTLQNRTEDIINPIARYCQHLKREKN